MARLEPALSHCAAVVVGDYGKGVVNDSILGKLKRLCRDRAIWLSLDPKPSHRVDLSGLSLMTPNRRETFELAGIADETRNHNPLADRNLMQAAEVLLHRLSPVLLLITLGELGMVLCQKNDRPIHIPTVAREVFDVSGAGDTVIASFTAAIAGGASATEAALIANFAAGIVVGKVGTATVTPEEILETMQSARRRPRRMLKPSRL
jgi:D-beta-D-heptose 7-phosphate kinase/D-beta-D-heptose 1-phosphate adenosyltransferase